MPLSELPVEFLFTLTVNVGEKPPVMIPNGPRGTRVLVTATGGAFAGPRISGTVSDTAGGDWVTLAPDGTMHLDVRVNLLTNDGAAIYMEYGGIGIRGADGSTSIRTAPRFQTGDERYSWLNTVQAVATGTTGKGTVTYDVYKVS